MHPLLQKHVDAFKATNTTVQAGTAEQPLTIVKNSLLFSYIVSDPEELDDLKAFYADLIPETIQVFLPKIEKKELAERSEQVVDVIRNVLSGKHEFSAYLSVHIENLPDEQQHSLVILQYYSAAPTHLQLTLSVLIRKPGSDTFENHKNETLFILDLK